LQYNFYPHQLDIKAATQKTQKIIDGYQGLIDSKEEWSFITHHNGVSVHHWFWVDDKWSVGAEINHLQIPNLWVHFRALAVPKKRRKTTQEAAVKEPANRPVVEVKLKPPTSPIFSSSSSPNSASSSDKNEENKDCDDKNADAMDCGVC